MSSSTLSRTEHSENDERGKLRFEAFVFDPQLSEVIGKIINFPVLIKVKSYIIFTGVCNSSKQHQKGWQCKCWSCYMTKKKISQKLPKNSRTWSNIFVEKNMVYIHYHYQAFFGGPERGVWLKTGDYLLKNGHSKTAVLRLLFWQSFWL